MERTEIYYAWNHEDPEDAIITFDKDEAQSFDYYDSAFVGENRYFVTVNDDESGYIVGIGNDFNKIEKDVKDIIRDEIKFCKEEGYNELEIDDSMTHYPSFYFFGEFDKDEDEEVTVELIWQEMLDNFRNSYVDCDSCSQRHIYDLEKDTIII